MPLRPRLFLDTNICINAATGKIAPEEWRRVRSYILQNYRYCISFITMKELFVKLARGGDEFFEKNKKPLNVMIGTGRKCFLP
jgi:predicted nucleic acid-binding protein